MNTHLLRSPYFGDLVFAAVGIASTLGWFEPSSFDKVSPLTAVGLLVLWFAEHFAFARRMRTSLLRVHRSMPDATEAEFAAALPSSYGTFVGAILRAALRLLPFVGALVALGILSPNEKDGVPIWLSLPLMLVELGFAAYWLFGTMPLTTRAVERDNRGRPVKARHHAPPGSWMARQLDRVRRTSPGVDFAAEMVLLVWSSLMFGFLGSQFAREMSGWPDPKDSMPPLVLTGFMVFATWMLALVVHIPLHLDFWLERGWSARTSLGRWKLRLSAWCAMAMGLGPAWIAWWRYMWS